MLCHTASKSFSMSRKIAAVCSWPALLSVRSSIAWWVAKWWSDQSEKRVVRDMVWWISSVGIGLFFRGFLTLHRVARLGGDFPELSGFYQILGSLLSLLFSSILGSICSWSRMCRFELVLWSRSLADSWGWCW